MVHLIHTRLTVLPRSKHKKRVPTQFSILPNHRKPIKILAKTKQATMKHITNHLITRQDISKQLLVSLNGLSWPCPQWRTEETQATTGGHNPSWHNPHFITKWNSNPLLFYKIKHQEKKKNQNSVHSNSNQIHCQQSAKNSLTHIAKTNRIHILVTQSTKF
jgi:hypothetical protein